MAVTIFRRKPTRLSVLAPLAAATLVSWAATPATAQDKDAGGKGAVQVQVRTDHHMHVHSPAILGFLPAYCSSPGRVGACDPAFVQPLTIDDLLRDMDAAGIRHGWLMSTAYLAHSPMMVPPAPDAAEILKSANDFTVGLARSHPDRISAFIGINPIADNALEELARWKGDPAVEGVKLHLTNSGVDLRDPDQVARLASVFGAAAENEITVMIHMRTSATDYGAVDVRIFLEDILPPARRTPVVIAHAGGWGGTNAFTLSALDAFAEAIEGDPSISANLYFDLAQVWDDETSPDDLQALADVMRRIGIDRFVPGSDWPFSDGLTTYYANVYPRLPLTPAEWSIIRSREVPAGVF